MIMTMVPVYLHVFINNSYICIVMRTYEAHSIIFSVMIVIIVIMIIILIIGIIMVPCNHSSDISFSCSFFSFTQAEPIPQLSPSLSITLSKSSKACVPCAVK